MAIDINYGTTTHSRKVSGHINFAEVLTYIGDNDAHEHDPEPDGTPYNHIYTTDGINSIKAWVSKPQYENSYAFRGGASISPGFGHSVAVSFELRYESLRDLDTAWPNANIWGYPASEYANGIWHYRTYITATLDFTSAPDGSDAEPITIDVGYYDTNSVSGRISNLEIIGSIYYEVSVELKYNKTLSVLDSNAKSIWIFLPYNGYDNNGAPPVSGVISYSPSSEANSYRAEYILGTESRVFEGVFSELNTCEHGIPETSVVPKLDFQCIADNQQHLIADAQIFHNEDLFTPQDTAFDWGDMGRIELEAGTLSMHAGPQGENSYPISNPGYTLVCRPHTLSYGVTCNNMDGTEVAAACDMASGVSGAANAAPLEVYYGGKWSLLSNGYPTTGNDIIVDDIPGADIGTLSCTHLLYGNITNLEALQQPIFRMTEAEFEAGDIYDLNRQPYSDSNIQAKSSAYWADALQFTLPTAKKKIIDFAAIDWVYTSGLTHSVVDGKLVVVVSGDAVSPKISKTFTDKFFNGGRYIQLDYASTDTSDTTIDLSIAGRQWAVSKASNIVDSITPKNLTAGGDATQSLLDSMDTPMRSLWTIRSAGDVEISLQPGFTYTFDALCLTRPASGGSVSVDIFGGSFVGDAVAHSRQSDGALLVPKSRVVNGSELASRRQSRAGIVFVDGAPDTEIYDIEHYTMPSINGDEWVHLPIELSSDYLLYPQSGNYLEHTINATQSWHSSTLGAAYLVAGNYTGANSAAIDWQPLLSMLILPWGELSATKSYSISKILRGTARARIIRTNGTPIIKVTLKYYNGGTIPYLIQEKILDEHGWIDIGSLPQPTTLDFEAKPYSFELTCGGQTVSFAMRNRNITLAQIIIGMPRILFNGSLPGQPIMFKKSLPDEPIMYIY